MISFSKILLMFLADGFFRRHSWRNPVVSCLYMKGLADSNIMRSMATSCFLIVSSVTDLGLTWIIYNFTSYLLRSWRLQLPGVHILTFSNSSRQSPGSAIPPQSIRLNISGRSFLWISNLGKDTLCSSCDNLNHIPLFLAFDWCTISYSNDLQLLWTWPFLGRAVS